MKHTYITQNTFKKVCEEMKPFADKKVILPLSKRLVLNYEFRNKLYGIVDESEIDVKRLIIEIDENILISDLPEFSFVLEEMLAKGFSFRVGRYGTGGMSMEILKVLPVSQISIAVNRLLQEDEEEEVIQYLKIVTDVAKKLDKSISFSGITDEAADGIAVECGGEYVEGEFYGPLLTVNEIK